MLNYGNMENALIPNPKMKLISKSKCDTIQHPNIIKNNERDFKRCTTQWKASRNDAKKTNINSMDYTSKEFSNSQNFRVTTSHWNNLEKANRNKS